MTPEGKQAISFFLPKEQVTRFAPLGDGNVNDTWLVRTDSGEKYVLQRLNPAVFPDPGLVQDNLCKVTAHLQARLKQDKGQADTGFKVLQLLTHNGEHSYIDQHRACWRLLSYIDNSQSLNSISTAEQAGEIGKALGEFHQLSSSLPASSLADPLPGFHITPLYLEQYDAILPENDNEATDCRDFINERRRDVPLLEEASKRGAIRQQVIHGDPKVANFLFSRDNKRVISLIDLDTVKPGLLLHDLGDCLRSCCNPLGEEVAAPSDVFFDKELFTAMLSGYFSRAADLLMPEDKHLLVDSVRLISFELGLRFYSDHLVGNHYFKVAHSEQNLFRARVQFALVRSIENQYTELVKTVQDFRFRVQVQG